MNSFRILAFCALALTAASVPAQTVITSVPYTITASGKYVLGNNVITPISSQTGIIIAAPNVILDLNGFYVSGPANSPDDRAISVANVSNVTIRNGTVANKAIGIQFAPGANSINHLVENVNFTRCSNVGLNFYEASPGSIARNNTFSQIGGSNDFGAYAILVTSGVRIENNSISNVTSGVASIGISMTDGSFAIGNTVSNAQVGISGGKYLNNLTSGCTTPFSGGVNATGNN